MVTAEQLDRIRRLALALAGIELFERHRELLGRRSRRQGLRDSTDWEALLEAAEAGEPLATGRLLGLVTTSHTSFLRHPAHFEAAAEQAFQAAREQAEVRLWSAAVATGEEAYSLALSVIERFGREDPPVRILATDLDPAALEVAERGEYAGPTLAPVDPERRRRFFRPTGQTDRWQVVPALRRLVAFRRMNLVRGEWCAAGPFEVVFCRNVLMYLEGGCRLQVLQRIADRLVPEGLLLLDPAEHLGAAASLFAPAGSGIFRRRPAAPRLADDPGGLHNRRPTGPSL